MCAPSHPPHPTLRDEDVPEDIEPASVQPVGNYAAQITWQDGFSQVAPYELIDALPRLSVEEAQRRRQQRAAAAADGGAEAGAAS